MGPCTRVEDDPVGESLEAVQVLDELAFVVGLKEPRLERQLRPHLRHLSLEVSEGDAAVVRRIATSELVEVDAVHDLDAVPERHELASSRTAAINARDSIAQ